MKLFNQISSLRKSQIYTILLFSAIFGLVFFIFFVVAKMDIDKRHNLEIENRLIELDNVINSYYKRDKLILNLSTSIAEDVIHNNVAIEENENNKVLYDVVDPYTKKSFKINANNWLIDGVSIINNFSLVDKIANLTLADISIYQKTDKAYINISTSIKSLRKERMLGDIILNNSKIVATIEKDNGYIGRQLIGNFWYQVSYKPLYIDGEIKGLYYIRIKEQTGRDLKKLYKTWSNSEFQTQFLLTKNGKILAHPNIKQGTDFSKNIIFRHIEDGNKNSGKFEFVSDEDNEEWTVNYSYNEITKSYICILYKSSSPHRILNKILLFSLISIILFAVLFYFLFRLSDKPLENELKRLENVIKSLINNQEVEEQQMPKERKFVKLAELVKLLTSKYSDLQKFAEGLTQDKFNQEYPETLINDKLGETLNKLNDKLRSVVYNEGLIKKEERLKEWESESVSKFINILQQHRGNIEELSYQLISNLVQYLNADVGALFFINSDNPNDIYFEQIATYAFEQKKYINKRIYPSQGYIGRIYNEKQTIYLTEVPEDYMKITSGLGNSSPKSLLIVPLLINKEVYGAIEIASFTLIKGFQIDFIEKMAENIASTINNVLVNNKTKELLNKSRQRADELSVEEEKMRARLKELEAKEQTISSKIYANADVSNSIENTIMVAEMDNEGIILFANDLLCKFLNIKKENIINSHYENFSNYVSVAEYKKIIDIWQNIEKGQSDHTTIQIKSDADTTNNVLTYIVPKLDNYELKSIVIMGVILKNEIDKNEE